MAPAKKRAHANTAGDTHSIQGPAATDQVNEDLRKGLNLSQDISLSQEDISDTISWAAGKHDDVNKEVARIAREICETEKKRVISFDHYSQTVWGLINYTSSMSGSKGCGAPFGVIIEIQGIVDSIMNQCGALASAGTRRNGLFVLGKISKSISLSSSTLAREVCNDIGSRPCLPDAMSSIVSAMSQDERNAIRDDENLTEGLWSKLEELLKLSDGRLFPGARSGTRNHREWTDTVGR